MTVSANTWAAVKLALRELVAGKIGSTRTVPAGRFSLGAPEGMRDATLAHRAKERTRIEIGLTGVSSQGFRGVLCSKWLERGDVTIKLVHWGDHLELDEARDEVRAQAADDHSLLAQALTWPQNLATTHATSGSVATGLVSGCLQMTEAPGSEKESWANSYLQTTRTYRAILERTAQT